MVEEVKRKKRIPAKEPKKQNKVLSIVGKVGIVFGVSILALVVGLYFMLWICCHGPSEKARDLFVGTFLETGALKWIPGLYFSDEEIEKITGNNSREHLDAEVDTDLIQIPDGDKDDDDENNTESLYNDNFDENGIQIIEVNGLTYSGKLMIVKDPSKVSVATIYPWSGWDKDKYGETLDVLVQNAGAIAGINGGEYESAGNWGGRPKGLVVCNGEIQYSAIQHGDVMIGFNEDNILVIKDLSGMSNEQVSAMVAEERIRDAVSFKDVEGGDDNHFAKLIINGETIQFTGNGSGANPRTVIGQRADGAVLMLVTDGRGHNGHVGATAADLISIMQEYGAVNAANLDGGSSSAMYYNGVWEMNSVTLYYATTSWRLPTGFVVK